MVHHSKINNASPAKFILGGLSDSEITPAVARANDVKDLFKLYRLSDLDDLMIKLGTSAGKRSFLVFKNHKYINILTENIAYFYVRYESTLIVTFDNQEYFVNYSLEQIQNLLPETKFFRINRQYLANFNAIKEAEHYFARKLLVNLTISTRDKLIVSKERVSDFLHWLDNR